MTPEKAIARHLAEAARAYKAVDKDTELLELREFMIHTLRPRGKKGMERKEFKRQIMGFCDYTWKEGYDSFRANQVAYSMIFGGTRVPYLLPYPGTTRIAITSKKEDAATIRANFYRKPRIKPQVELCDGAGI
jgi:hypothetical protein